MFCRRQIGFALHAEYMLDALRAELIDEDLSVDAGRVLHGRPSQLKFNYAREDARGPDGGLDCAPSRPSSRQPTRPYYADQGSAPGAARLTLARPSQPARARPA